MFGGASWLASACPRFLLREFPTRSVILSTSVTPLRLVSGQGRDRPGSRAKVRPLPCRKGVRGARRHSRRALRDPVCLLFVWVPGPTDFELRFGPPASFSSPPVRRFSQCYGDSSGAPAAAQLIVPWVHCALPLLRVLGLRGVFELPDGYSATPSFLLWSEEAPFDVAKFFDACLKVLRAKLN